jgi:hypothetical protein
VANCDLVCDTVSVCGVEPEGECFSGCSAVASEASGVSSACSDDFAALNACLGGLNCDQLGDWALMSLAVRPARDRQIEPESGA